MAFFTKSFISNYSDKTRRYSFESYNDLLNESIKESAKSASNVLASRISNIDIDYEKRGFYN